MLGANVGTTLIVQVLALNIAALAPILFIIGLVAFRGGAGTRIKSLGRAAIGLGLMLLALHILLDTLAPAENAPDMRVLLNAVTDDPDALRNLATRLAPDVAGPMAECVRQVPTAALRLALPESGGPAVLAIARRPPVDLPALLAVSAAPLVFLERPTHLGNLGATIRTAAAADAAGVLASGIHDPWHPHAIRGSAGTWP